MAKSKEKSFEEQLRRLQEISEKLEDDETGIEDSIKLYEEGIKLAKYCYNTLDKAQLRVTELKNELEEGLK